MKPLCVGYFYIIPTPRLKKRGISRFFVFNILQCVYCEDNIVPTEDELLKLEDAHYRKIDLSDGIYVVNMDGYIGTSVKKEIEYAERHGKEVLYHYNQ